jgi:hypothetical protein
MGYGSAIMVHKEHHDLKEVIEHLANTAIHDEMTVAHLVQANKNPTQQVKTMQKQIDILIRKVDGNKSNEPQDKN